MLKWFTVSLATLILSTVVSATGVLFVKPTNDTPCPEQPCHTLEHYAQSWQLYLTSNTTVQILAGEHVLEGDWNELSVVNFSKFLIGSDGVILDSSPLYVYYGYKQSQLQEGRNFLQCHQVVHCKAYILRVWWRGSYTLLSVKCLTLHLTMLPYETALHGTGLMGVNLRESSIHRSAFVFSQATGPFPCSGNIMLYAKCSEMSETITLNITSSLILFGCATTKRACSSGLVLQVSQFCYNVKVHIQKTTWKENVGGNMFLLLNGFAHNIITIADSYFEGGYASQSGGGILIITSFDGSQGLPNAQNNLVYINNTEFVRNQAEIGGAMAVSPCAGTELHINGSKFYNNEAYDGGHIAFVLSSSHTKSCTNMTITISNSVFERGNATGSGGGVSVQGAYSISQCANGNHISISNTKFVGNYAKLNGGAVSLQGCIGTELHIDESEFYNNETPFFGGHIALQLNSCCIQFIIVNNSHFESGRA